MSFLSNHIFDGLLVYKKTEMVFAYKMNKNSKKRKEKEEETRKKTIMKEKRYVVEPVRNIRFRLGGCTTPHIPFSGEQMN